MVRLFGTDGVRGLAGVDVTAELALGLMIAAQRQPHPFRAPRVVAALLARWVRPAAPAGVPPAVLRPNTITEFAVTASV